VEGTPQNGILRFNDTNWTVYNSNNTGQPINFVQAMTIDYLNNIWIGTQFYGLVKFNYSQNQWTVYNSTNSGLPGNNLFSVYTLKHIKYIGTSSGLAIYNDTNWTVFNENNLPLPSSTISSIVTDKYWNIWIGTGGGLAIYNANGIIGVENKQINIPIEFELFQNYPNPFNPYTTIEYDLKKSSNIKINIYNINGQLIHNFSFRNQRPGKYKIDFDGNKLPSGIYFYRLETDKFTDTKKMILVK